MLNLVTDFSSDFENWNDYLNTTAGQRDVRLFIPAGTYACAGQHLVYQRVSQRITVIGEDRATTILNVPGGLANNQTPVVGLSGPQPHIETATAGDRTVTLLDAGDAAEYKVGDWVCVVAYDLQGQGFPQNQQFFEYKKIIRIDSDAGVLTLHAPLIHTYKSTYPVISDGSSFVTPDEYGAAGLIHMTDEWDSTITHMNYTATNVIGQWFGTCRNITCVNCDFSGGYEPGISLATVQTFRNCLFGSGSLEVDKLIEKLAFIECDIPALLHQSASIRETILTDCTVGTSNGTPNRYTISGCTFANISFGAGLGAIDSISITDSSATAYVHARHRTPLTNFTYDGDDGTLTIDAATGYGENQQANLAPGGWYLLGQFDNEIVREVGPAFQVTDVTVDGDDWVFHTTLSGTVPQFTTAGNVGGNPAGATHINKCNCPSLTVTNSTGGFAPLSYAAAAGLAAGEYYNSGEWDQWPGVGDPASSHGDPYITLYGEIVQITVEVITPYTGVESSLLLTFMGDAFNGATTLNNSFGESNYHPQIDLKTAGTRVITPSSVTGTAGADANLSASNVAWVVGRTIGSLSLNNSIAGEAPGVWPTVQVEVILDQGIS